MANFNDNEFGSIEIKRQKRSRNVKIQLRHDGTLEAIMPPYAPLFLVKRLLNSSRTSIRKMLASQPAPQIADGMQIGKSHHLNVTNGEILSARVSGQTLMLQMPNSLSLLDSSVRSLLREHIVKILRKEAKSYLPRRLSFFS